jgi:peptidoglycan/LPS O-acetylase OafA/YrhL
VRFCFDMKKTTIEILHILAGLAVAVAITWAAAWSYPLGQDVIWTCGAAAMVATVLMGVGPLRRARRLDQTTRRSEA